jgi:hypothetical protein
MEDKIGCHVALMGEMQKVYRVFTGKPYQGDHVEDLGVDGISKYVL